MFADVVRLYRESGRPKISGSRFRYEGSLSPELADAIHACRALNTYEGYFEEEPEVTGEHVEFEWYLASNEFGRFYRNVEDFVENAGTLSAGLAPEHFYIIDEDVLGGVDDPSPRLDLALTLSRLIAGLARLALGDSSHGVNRKHLLFVLPAGADKPPRTIELETTITIGCLSAPKPDLSILDDLTRDGAERVLHFHEHRQLFRVAVASLLSKRQPQSPEGAFQFLVFNWADLVQTYQLNADCYVQKFSFEKLRNDIARLELDYATRVAAVLGDGSSKLLALPLSLGGLAAIFAASTFWEAAVLVLGTLLVSLLLGGTIHNQMLAAKRIEAGFNLAVSDIDGGDEKYPTALVRSIRDAKEGFSGQIRFMERVYGVVRPISWVPPLIGTAIVVVRYGDEVIRWVYGILVVVPLVFGVIFWARRKPKED